MFKASLNILALIALTVPVYCNTQNIDLFLFKLIEFTSSDPLVLLTDFHSSLSLEFVRAVMDKHRDVYVHNILHKSQLPSDNERSKRASTIITWVVNENIKMALQVLNGSMTISELDINLGLYDVDNTLIFVLESDVDEGKCVIFEDGMVQLHKRSAILFQSSNSTYLQRYDVCNRVEETLLSIASDSDENISKEIFPSYKMNGYELHVSILPVGYIVSADEDTAARLEHQGFISTRLLNSYIPALQGRDTPT
jgi:hypothetical protein